jgi:2-C-methyl-D-erythritol 4-phosphate cytidylyltransferase
MGYTSRSTIAKIEVGANDIPQSKMTRLARVLDTTVEYLKTGTGTGGGFSTQPGTNPAGAAKNRGADKTAVIVLAGGKSTRNLQNIPNQFINVLGKPVIIYCLEAYQRHPSVDDIYIVCLKGWESIVESYGKQYGITKLAGIVSAGETGIKSVRNGVVWLCDKAIYSPDDTVILQEATRPLITEEMISKLLYACNESSSAVICKPMDDYIQFIQDDNGKVTYMDRNRLLSLEAPEAYQLKTLIEAFDKANTKGHAMNETCCAMMMYNLGYKLNFCEGNNNNIKIIRQEDIAIFSALLKQII